MNIVINRGKRVKFEDLQDYSIALDGFCYGGPKIDPDKHRFNFDHHEGCLRFATLATCSQVRYAILMGLEELEKYTVYLNDVDSDTAASVWCLANPDRMEEPLVKKLIDAIGISDAYLGAVHQNGIGKTIEWICAPETDSKRNNDYCKLSDDGLKAILESVLHRIDLFANGEAQIEISKQPKHGEYKVLREENGWALVETSDPHVFGNLYHAGFTRLVIIRPQSDGTNAITLAKKSEFINNFPLEKLYDELNKIEPGFGGSNTVGGCVRNSDGSRSRLGLSTLIQTIDKVILTPQS